MADITDVTDETFEAEVLQGEMLVVVDFWAPWCGPCLMLAPVLEELSEEYDGRAKFVRLNTDENPGMAGKYEILSIPTLIFVKDGEVQDDPLRGFRPKSALVEYLDELLSEA